MNLPTRRPQLIDSVLSGPSVHKKPATVIQPPAGPTPQKAPPRLKTTIDGVVGRPVPTAHRAVPTAAAVHWSKHSANYSPAKKVLKKRSKITPLFVMGNLLGAIAVGLALYSLTLGELLIGIYSVYAIWKWLPSRQIFVVALASFGGIIVCQLISPDSGIANNIAVYAFLLLVLGTFLLAREVWQEKKYSKS